MEKLLEKKQQALKGKASLAIKTMARVNLNVPDELLQKLADDGKNPTDFLQERLVALSVESSKGLSDESSLVSKFQILARQWRQETRHLSLTSDIVLNTAYQQIIGMGSPVVPLLLQALKEQPDHWFWALRSITGGNPILPADRGRSLQMTEAWLQWGRQHGYQC